MQVRKLFIFIGVFLVALGSFAGDAFGQRNTGRPDTGPFEFMLGWQRAGDITLAPPLQQPMVVERAGSFVGSFGYRPQEYVTFSLGLVNSPNAASSLTVDRPRMTADENTFFIGGSLATGFMQPQPKSRLSMRFRGGGTFGLTSSDLQLQAVSTVGLVSEKHYASTKEHTLFMALDAGFRDLFGRATGVFFLSLQYSRRFVNFDGLPLGTDAQVSHDTFRIGIGLAP